MGDLFSSSAWKSLQYDLGKDADTIKTKFCIKIMLLKVSLLTYKLNCLKLEGRIERDLRGYKLVLCQRKSWDFLVPRLHIHMPSPVFMPW